MALFLAAEAASLSEAVRCFHIQSMWGFPARHGDPPKMEGFFGGKPILGGTPISIVFLVIKPKLMMTGGTPILGKKTM